MTIITEIVEEPMTWVFLMVKYLTIVIFWLKIFKIVSLIIIEALWDTLSFIVNHMQSRAGKKVISQPFSLIEWWHVKLLSNHVLTTWIHKSKVRRLLVISSHFPDIMARKTSLCGSNYHFFSYAFCWFSKQRKIHFFLSSFLPFTFFPSYFLKRQIQC